MHTMWSGGLKLKGYKTISNQQKSITAPIPNTLIIPLQQHIGQLTHPVVQVGDKVKKGQCIAQSKHFISAAVHASSSGTVTAIENHPVAHPSQLATPCIIIKTDGKEEWITHHGTSNYQQLSRAELRDRIGKAGIVGLGGAVFPTQVKLTPPSDTRITTLILNGAECEPYITCDDRLMREQASEILQGMAIIAYILKVPHVIIGIEDNKPQAYQTLQHALSQTALFPQLNVEIIQVPTIYPAGGEKQLIYTLTGKKIPSYELPAQQGIVCHNVATCFSVYEAIVKGIPLISRLVTVTGQKQGFNVRTLIGTPIQDLLDYVAYHPTIKHTLIMGGPMMGTALSNTRIPIVKASNCILLQDTPPFEQTMPCIRCAQCSHVCPVNLLPQQLYWYARSKEFDKIQDIHLFDCIECGCCSYVCPSHIPLVHYYRYAKTEIWNKEKQKQKADLARTRHEFHLFRLEREKKEKAERHKKKKTTLNKTKTDAIQAALQRTKAKKQPTNNSDKNTMQNDPNPTDSHSQVSTPDKDKSLL